jgi:hypothetical protein
VQPSDSLPADPVDALIVRLIRDESAVATPEDVAAIVDRMASAPFNRHPMHVRRRDRDLIAGHALDISEADPLAFHLAKRVRQEHQWSAGTTPEAYVRDLRASCQHPRASVLVHTRAADLVAATIAPTADVVPMERRGSDWLPQLIVVYSARRGNVRTGYMFSTLEKLNLPETVRWLR